MLFHKTRDVRLRQDDPAPGVHTVKLGDGHDAARSIVLTEVFFSELDEGTFRFSTPNQDLLYYVQALDEKTLEALAQATREAYEASDYPLSSELFELAPTRGTTRTRARRRSRKIFADASRTRSGGSRPCAGLGGL